MRPGGSDQRAALRGGVADGAAEIRCAFDGFGDAARDVRRDLDRRLHQLRSQPLVVGGFGDLVVTLDELVALRADDLELLFDPDGERLAAAEVDLPAARPSRLL